MASTKTIVSLTPSTNPKPLLKPRDIVALDPVAEVYQALVLGTRDYIRKNGFEKVVIGLSGGVDSAIVATIAVDALGRITSSEYRCPHVILLPAVLQIPKHL